MSRLARGLVALLLGGVVGAVAGAAAFAWPMLIGQPEFFLAWGWVAFFVGPAVAVAVWTVATTSFYAMLARRSVAPWVITGISLLPVVGVWLAMIQAGKWRWTEDVRLADGSIVVVERSARIEHAGIVELDASMKFTGALAYLGELRVPVEPLVLYMDEETGEWVIVTITSTCEVLYPRGPPRFWFAADRPQTIYLEFRWRNARWVQTPLSATSIGRPANLFTGFEGAKISHVSVATKDSFLGSVGAHRQSVVERPSTNCGHTTETRAIWAAEDRVLAALDRENATAEQRARVGELLAGTRFVGRGFPTAAGWQQDTDPTTVEILSLSRGSSASASDDGQVIYLNVEAGDSFKESYSRRLRAAGFAQFAE